MFDTFDRVRKGRNNLHNLDRKLSFPNNHESAFGRELTEYARQIAYLDSHLRTTCSTLVNKPRIGFRLKLESIPRCKRSLN